MIHDLWKVDLWKDCPKTCRTNRTLNHSLIVLLVLNEENRNFIYVYNRFSIVKTHSYNVVLLQKVENMKILVFLNGLPFSFFRFSFT